MLTSQGFLEGHAPLSRSEALTYFSRIGRPVAGSRHPELVRDIRPQAIQDAPPNTLSSTYGDGAFPFHTDCAHWPRPPRYLVLYCVDPGSGGRETHLVSPSAAIDNDERRVLRRALWRVRGIRQPFLARVLDGVCGDEFFRYDLECMAPIGNHSKSTDLFSVLLGECPVQRIDWEPGKYLIVDNWKLLHARGPAQASDRDRLHWRILLE